MKYTPFLITVRHVYAVYARMLWFPGAATGGVLKEKCSYKFRKFHRKKPMLDSLFNNATGIQASNFIERDSNTVVFLWNLWHF